MARRVTVDPDVTVTAPRPGTWEILLVTCDAAGACCQMTLPRDVFAQMAGDSLLSMFSEGTAQVHANGTG